MTDIFITAIDTDSGKTLVSSIFCEAFKADYWKPIQSGLPRDTETVKSLISNSSTTFHKEAYLLNTPASPHASSAIDGVLIEMSKIVRPVSERRMVIEGAGGCLVPLNDNDFVIDIAKKLNVAVVVVADLYLGSINHTLLTIEALRKRSVNIGGIVFNGTSNPQSERIILKHTKLECLLKIDRAQEVNRELVKKYADQLRHERPGFPG